MRRELKMNLFKGIMLKTEELKNESTEQEETDELEKILR